MNQMNDVINLDENTISKCDSSRTSSVTKFLKKLIYNYNTILMLIILIVMSTILHDRFMTANNIMNILKQNAAAMIIAMGMLFVILTGGIDLSVGSVAAFGSVGVATGIVAYGMSTGLSIITTLVLGMILGLFTGILVSFVKMAPFISSLAMMTIARGLALIISNGGPIKTPDGTLDVIGKWTIGVLPGIMIIAIVVITIFFTVHKFTGFGRIVIAIGSNSSAVRLAGIKVEHYLLSVYALSGLCAALAGIISASRTYLGSPTTGVSMELDAIAAVVIGGGSLAGGKGYVVRTIAGVIILGLISNVMNLVGVPPYPQDVIKGFIIIGAVVLQGVTNNHG